MYVQLIEVPYDSGHWGVRLGRVYLHLDLDVLDPAEGRANAYAAPGGLRLEQVREAIAAVRAHVPVAAATLSAFDPAADPDGRALAAGLQMLDAVATPR
jgi:arginase